MKTLLVLRHGKSSWSDPPLSDRQRPLKKRGKRGARAIGRQLPGLGLVPDLILSSRARRARATARLCREACGGSPSLVRAGGLYASGVDRHLEVIRREADDLLDVVMVVGHNPDLEDLVERLTGRDVLLKTANLAVIDLPIDSWSELGAAPGSLRLHLEPGPDARDEPR